MYLFIYLSTFLTLSLLSRSFSSMFFLCYYLISRKACTPYFIIESVVELFISSLSTLLFLFLALPHFSYSIFISYTNLIFLCLSLFLFLLLYFYQTHCLCLFPYGFYFFFSISDSGSDPALLPTGCISYFHWSYCGL